MNNRTIYCMVLSSILVFSSALNAEERGAPAIEPQADSILRQMSEYMNTLEQFAFHVENTTDLVLLSGHKMQVGEAVHVFVRRPDRLKAEVKGDLRSQQLFYDGKTITLYGRNVNYYAVTEAPSTIEAAFDIARERFGLTAPAADLVYQNTYDILTEDVNSGYYLGLHNVHDIECHHLLFSQDDVDWQIWIENSQTPVPRKMVISEKWIAGGPQFTAVFSSWEISAELKDSLFIFVPPDKAERIEFLPADKNGADR